MTNEEAVKFAECLKNNWTINFDDLEPFCDMAIEALKQQPCEDCISRQAAIDAADKIIERDTSGSNAVVNAMIAWSEYIKTLPSVMPQPKTGKWIYRTIRGEKRPCCSECGEGTDTIYEYKFCPNCGAKMEAENESGD